MKVFKIVKRKYNKEVEMLTKFHEKEALEHFGALILKEAAKIETITGMDNHRAILHANEKFALLIESA